MQYEQAREVADAILYDGHQLHPVPTVFPAGRHHPPSPAGVLAPREWAEQNLPLDTGTDGGTESWFTRTECVAECPPGTTLTVRLRFLAPQRRTVERYVEGTGFVPADHLDVDGELLYGGDEAVPHERDVTADVALLCRESRSFLLSIAGSAHSEVVHDRTGRIRGRIRRRCMPMEVGVVLGATDAGVVVPMVRLRAVVENLTPSVSPDVPPMVARCQSMLATHLFIGLSDGCFVSMFSPPSWAADAVGACTNIHTFPVLAGDEGRDDLMLSAPVPLGDRPRGVPVTLGEMLEAAEPAIDAAIYPSEA